MAERRPMLEETDVYIQSVEEASDEILAILLGINTLAEARASQAQIQAILDSIYAESIRYANYAPNEIYSRALGDAEQVIARVGVVIEEADLGLHTTLVQEFTEEMRISFAQNIQAVQRGIRQAVSQATRVSIQASLARKRKSERIEEIKDIFEKQGTKGLVDRGGRRWTLDRYATMLARTKEMEAFNLGIINRSAELGVDFMRVSDTGSLHEECAIWQNRIVAIRPGLGYPTVDEARATGLFHPNCYHVLIPAPEFLP